MRDHTTIQFDWIYRLLLNSSGCDQSITTRYHYVEAVNTCSWLFCLRSTSVCAKSPDPLPGLATHMRCIDDILGPKKLPAIALAHPLSSTTGDPTGEYGPLNRHHSLTTLSPPHSQSWHPSCGRRSSARCRRLLPPSAPLPPSSPACERARNPL